LLIRIGYLIAVPVAAWFLLAWIWRVWEPDAAAEDRLERALGAATGGVLAILAILAVTADTHTENTMSVLTRDGWEDVGDDIVVPRPDLRAAFVWIVLSGGAFWFSITKKESKQ
jgi:hypothetical protein